MSSLHPAKSWQLSHDAPAPRFLSLMAGSVCHPGKLDIPSRGRGLGVNESIDGQRKAPLWPRGQAWAPVCSHTASLWHTLARLLRTESQERRSRDRSRKVPWVGRGASGEIEKGSWQRWEGGQQREKAKKEQERLTE